MYPGSDQQVKNTFTDDRREESHPELRIKTISTSQNMTFEPHVSATGL